MNAEVKGASLKTILVSGLSAFVKQSELLRLFEEYGSVIGVDLVEGQDFGFIRMANDEEARKAIKALDGTSCSDATLSICAAGTRRQRELAAKAIA
jgi:RNA recognition motif-containing protein